MNCKGDIKLGTACQNCPRCKELGWDVPLPVMEMLNRLPEVTWDRWTGDGRIHACVFGWIAREDGKADFVVVKIDRDGEYFEFLLITSSARYSREFAVRLGMNGNDHKPCQRVEDQWPEANCVRMAKRCPDCGARVPTIFEHVDGCPGEEDKLET